MSVSVVLSDELAEAARRVAGESRKKLSDAEQVKRGVAVALLKTDPKPPEGLPSFRTQEELEALLLQGMNSGPGVVADDAFWADLNRRVDEQIAAESRT